MIPKRLSQKLLILSSLVSLNMKKLQQDLLLIAKPDRRSSMSSAVHPRGCYKHNNTSHWVARILYFDYVISHHKGTAMWALHVECRIVKIL